MNIFDEASEKVQQNMIRDVQGMALFECNAVITIEQARRIARTILRGKREQDSLYRVTTKRLYKLVTQGKP